MLSMISLQVITNQKKVKYNFVPIRMNIIRKMKNTNVGKDIEKLELISYWQECKMVQPFGKKKMAGPQNAKLRVPM